MDQSTKDAGTIAALMIRISEYHLLLAKRHPEHHELIARALNFYTEIITKGLENEKAQ